MNKHELINSIRAMTLTATDEAAVRSIELYPDWAAGLDVKTGERYQCDGRLYKCIVAHTTQDNWRPSQETASVWQVIDITHTGTLEDPIPAVVNMEYIKGLYYIEDGVVYFMDRAGMKDGEAITLQYLPSQLVGQYFVII